MKPYPVRQLRQDDGREELHVRQLTAQATYNSHTIHFNLMQANWDRMFIKK